MAVDQAVRDEAVRLLAGTFASEGLSDADAQDAAEWLVEQGAAGADLGSPGPAAAAAAPGLPRLVTIPDVEILAAGTWQLSTGRQTFTRQDLAAAVDASTCPAVGAPVIKIGHLDQRFAPAPDGNVPDGEPALGRLANMRTDKAGVKLRADLAGMPGWLAGISAAAFPRRSVEGTYNFECQIGHKHPFVITALALLGITQPGVGVLQDLHDLSNLFYHAAGPAGAGEPWRTGPIEHVGGTTMPVTEEDVRRAFYAGSEVPQSWWITELQMFPSQLIVSDGDGRVYQVPFAIQGSSVNFGSPAELDSYEQVTAARGSGAVMVFASAEESRQMAAQGDSGGDRGNINTPDAADLDTAARQYCASQGWSLPDGSYPVRPPELHGVSDLSSAVQAVGRGSGSHDAIRRHITARAQAIGEASRLPDTWVSAATCVVDAAGNHAVYSGTHDHAHPAMGSQGGDATHSHSHTHSNDAGHAHAHASADNQNGASEVDFTDEQMASLRATLGLEDGQEITPALIVDSYKKRVAAARPPSGLTVTIDKGDWESINAKVKSAEEYQRRQQVKERDQVIAAAVRDGRFSASRKPLYMRAWDTDPDGARALIESLPKNAVPISDIGSPGGDGDELLPDEYKSLFPPGSVRN